MKISSILCDLLAFRTGHAALSDAAWADDPYAHPEICAMTERERADLPPVHMPARLAMDVAFGGARASLAGCS